MPTTVACVPSLGIVSQIPSSAAVSDAAPGVGNYNGGRWAVIQAFGISTQLTNAEDVVAEASSLVDTGHRFVCPLIKIAN